MVYINFCVNLSARVSWSNLNAPRTPRVEWRVESGEYLVYSVVSCIAAPGDDKAPRLGRLAALAITKQRAPPCISGYGLH